MKGTSLLERTRGYFEQYAALYMRSEADAIANRFYEAPFVAVRRGEPIHMATTARGGRQKRIVVAARAASDFQFWRSLEALGDRQAAELGAGLVELAAAA